MISFSSLFLEHEPHDSSDHVANTIKYLMQRSITIHEGRSCDHFVTFISVRLLL